MRALEQAMKASLTDPRLLIVWGVLVAISLAILARDLVRNNAHLMSLMKWVWRLTVLYSGPIGLTIYWFSGRKEIGRDSLWRKGFRSVAHCYSGCGLGEIAGVLIVAGLLSLGQWPVAITTFILAYVAGFALTVGPLVQDGEKLGRAMWDAFTSETASITVMEVTAVAIDLWFGGNARIDEPLFWSSLVFSLSMGLAAAYPVNVLLIHFGIKAGMHDPRHHAKANQSRSRQTNSDAHIASV